MYKNRASFRVPANSHKKHFGYRFENSSPINPSSSYGGFKGAIADYRNTYKFSLSFDVASYFNSIYHHDLVSWFANLNVEESDYQRLGQFLREINSGRSVDCLPQGLYPTKMIGNDFLRFVEEHFALKASAVVRFMDDFVLFSDDISHLRTDFVAIQKLLGERGLSLNPNKTIEGITDNVEFVEEVDEIKAKLLQRRRMVIATYDGPDQEVDFDIELDEDETDYLFSLLGKDNIEEEDAELVLALVSTFSEEVFQHLLEIASSYPHLAKNIYAYCSRVEDTNAIADFLLGVLNEENQACNEYQLFWYAKIFEDSLLDSPKASAILNKLYYHPNATLISKAKILEIPEKRYGLVEFRDQQLGAGQSDWLAWASAVGHTCLPKISRSHKLKYFAKSSNMNHLIHEVVSKHP